MKDITNMAVKRDLKVAVLLIHTYIIWYHISMCVCLLKHSVNQATREQLHFTVLFQHIVILVAIPT